MLLYPLFFCYPIMTMLSWTCRAHGNADSEKQETGLGVNDTFAFQTRLELSLFQYVILVLLVLCSESCNSICKVCMSYGDVSYNTTSANPYSWHCDDDDEKARPTHQQRHRQFHQARLATRRARRRTCHLQAPLRTNRHSAHERC